MTCLLQVTLWSKLAAQASANPFFHPPQHNWFDFLIILLPLHSQPFSFSVRDLVSCGCSETATPVKPQIKCTGTLVPLLVKATLKPLPTISHVSMANCLCAKRNFLDLPISDSCQMSYGGKFV